MYDLLIMDLLMINNMMIIIHISIKIYSYVQILIILLDYLSVSCINFF